MKKQDLPRCDESGQPWQPKGAIDCMIFIMGSRAFRLSWLFTVEPTQRPSRGHFQFIIIEALYRVHHILYLTLKGMLLKKSLWIEIETKYMYSAMIAVHIYPHPKVYR